MGHSFGGAITEILLDHGLGAAGVGIDAAAVRGDDQAAAVEGASVAFSVPGRAWPTTYCAVALTEEQFHYAFTNTLSEEESAEVYKRYAAPGPGRVLRQGAAGQLQPLHARPPDNPQGRLGTLLLIAGEVDHVVPASVDRQAAAKQSKSAAITEYKEFPDGRTSRSARRWLGRGRRLRQALDWAIEHQAPAAA